MTYKNLQTLLEQTTESATQLQDLINNARCPKCVYEGTCQTFDRYGDCKKYKRDPPDGGYYG